MVIILKKVIINKISTIWTIWTVLNPQQYGFHKGITTAPAILNTITSAFNNINRNQFTAIFFLDLKKAFDTVCDKTLLRS